MSKVQQKGAGRPVKRTKKAANVGELTTEAVRHLPKAPSDYEETARKFAEALDATKFRGGVSGAKVRALVARGAAIGRKAATLRAKAEAADRARIVAESRAWKTLLSTWRRVVAAMPDEPMLARAFGFMREYMAVGSPKKGEAKKA